MEHLYLELINLIFNLEELLAFNAALFKQPGRVVYGVPKDHAICTKLADQLAPFGLIVDRVSLNELQQDQTMQAHIDPGRNTAINIPISGNFKDNPIWWSDVSHAYTCPTAINVNVIHSVKKVVDGPRVMLTVGILGTWDENLPKFKKFNDEIKEHR